MSTCENQNQQNQGQITIFAAMGGSLFVEPEVEHIQLPLAQDTFIVDADGELDFVNSSSGMENFRCKERLVKIKGKGFLSRTGLKCAQKIATRNVEVLHALELTIFKFREVASSQEVHKQDTEGDRQKIIALVLAVRLLEIAEAALLIMRNGMSNEANTLFRVFLDAYFVFSNVCNDASFVIDYFKSDEAARLKLLNSIEKHSSCLFKKANDYASATLKSELKQKIAEEQIQAFNSYAYADNVGCSEIYDSMYRLTSAILHTAPRSLEKYTEEDENGIIVEIKDFPVEGDIPKRGYDFSYFLIKSLSGLKKVFGCYDAREIETMVCRLNESCKVN